MAVAPLVPRNIEGRKIPNPSLTGATSVFSTQIRRKLEFFDIIHYNNSTEAFVPPRQPCGCIPMRLFTYLQFYGAIDMYDKSMIAQLLPSEMIIKNYIHGNPDCNYERYLLEFVNASDFFRTKSGGDIYQSPESEENGQCDCISTSYQLDFKLIASKTALQAKSILYPSKTEIVKGVFVTSEPKVKNGSIKATRIHAALREYDFEGLQKLRTTTIKKQGVENDIIELLKTLETRKHLLLFFPYKFIFNDKYEFLAGIAQIQNALNSDFRCAMQYRTHEVGADFDTYIAFIYDDKIVFMIENAAHLSYIDSVNLTKSPVYMRLLDYSW